MKVKYQQSMWSMVKPFMYGVHVILHQACFYYYYYYYYLFFFFNGDQCFMSGDHFYNFRLQTGVLGALHCHVYSNNNYCHGTISAVQILKIAFIRRDPLMAQTVSASHSKALYARLPSVESKQCFFRLYLPRNGKQQALRLGRT